MDKTKETREKLKLIGQQAVQRVILDVLMLADQELTDEDITDGSIVEYARVCSKLCAKQRGIYKTQIRVQEQIVPRQIDLEDSIRELKEIEAKQREYAIPNKEVDKSQ